MYAQFFVLFAMIFTGYILRKIHLINDEMNSGLNSFILFFSFPCLIIQNIGTLEISSKVLGMFITTAGLAFVVIFVGTFISYGYVKARKFPERIRGVIEFAMTNPNSGFLGFPVALLCFGQNGLLLMISSCFAFNIYTYGYGIVMLHRGEKKEKQKGAGLKLAVKTILNPNILALFAGLAITLTGITIPSPLLTFLSYMGGIATPMAMVYIGSSLAGSKFFEMFKNHIVWESAAVKLLLLPAVTTLIVYFLPVGSLVKMITVLMMAFPTAALVPMLSEQEGKDSSIATKVLFFSTVLSMATLPFWITVITKLFA